MPEIEYISRKAASRYLREQGFPVSPTTLAIWACTGEGPPYYRYRNRLILYRKSELDQWRDSQLRRVDVE